jgi:hypothetical protein
MKIHIPVLWGRSTNIDYSDRHIKLSAILPRAGQTVKAYFSQDDRPADGEICKFLWRPPLSEINGFSDYPKDILHSYVITGRGEFRQYIARDKTEKSHLNEMLGNSLEYTLSITDVESFLAVCNEARDIPSNFMFAYCMKQTPSGYISELSWKEAYWSGLAYIDDYCFLRFHLQEVYVEMLLKQERGELVVHYFSVTGAGGDHHMIGRQNFNVEEYECIKSLMKKAVALKDSFDDHLLIDV